MIVIDIHYQDAAWGVLGDALQKRVLNHLESFLGVGVKVRAFTVISEPRYDGPQREGLVIVAVCNSVDHLNRPMIRNDELLHTIRVRPMPYMPRCFLELVRNEMRAKYRGGTVTIEDKF